jgi:hypothetical protein
VHAPVSGNSQALIAHAARTIKEGCAAFTSIVLPWPPSAVRSRGVITRRSTLMPRNRVRLGVIPLISMFGARVSCLATVVALLAPASLVQAQAVEAPTSGDRLRVTAPSIALERRPAHLVARRGDTVHLLLRGRSDTVALPVSAITQLEVSRGTYRPWARNGLVGLVAGTALGVVSAAIFVENETNCVGRSLCGEEKGFAMFGLGLMGGIGGGVVGVIVGTQRPVDRWKPVPLDRLTGRPGPRSSERRTAFSLSVRL